MKKNKVRHGKAFRFTLTGILLTAALLAMSLTACAGKKNFKASETMLSDIEVYKSVEGLDKLDDKLKAEFVETINKKYDISKLTDLSGTAEMEIKAAIVNEQLGGIEMEMSMGGDAGFEVDKANELSHMNMDLKISVMGMNLPMSVEEYTDSKNNVSYSRGNMLGESGDWEKSTTESTDDSEKDDGNKRETLLSEEDIIAIYQDPESKTYAVQIQIKEDSASSALLGGVESSMSSTAESDFDISKAEVIATLDEGLAFAGLYVDFAESLNAGQGEDQSDFQTATAVLKLTSYNAGNTITIPEEVLNAKEKEEDGNDADGVFDMFGAG